MSHKSHLLSCALRCSSKLQKIQSLENFASMATQGTQVQPSKLVKTSQKIGQNDENQ